METRNDKYRDYRASLIKEGSHISFFKANIYDENHNIVANMEANYYYK